MYCVFRLCQINYYHTIPHHIKLSKYCNIDARLNFPKEIETFFKKKLKRFKEKSLKMQQFSSELPFHIHEWLINN